jgi:hypothetical protein
VIRVGTAAESEWFGERIMDPFAGSWRRCSTSEIGPRTRRMVDFGSGSRTGKIGIRLNNLRDVFEFC